MEAIELLLLIFRRKLITNGVACLGIVVAATASGPEIITQWDFNSVEADLMPATGRFEASIGTGVSSAIGTMTNSFGSVASGATSDPNTADNSQVRLAGFPAQGNANKSSGLEFRTSTAGFENIRLTWDHYNSGSASRYWRVQYTVDGSIWQDHEVFTNTNASSWRRENLVSFRSIAGANDNPNFGVRLVSEFEQSATGSGTDEYRAVSITGNYSSAGTLWVDLVTIHGDSLTGGNQQPTISAISAQSTRVNTPTAQIVFSVGDTETAPNELVVSYEISDPRLIGETVLGGSGADRTIVLTPAQDQSGSTAVRIRVTDAGGKFAETSFTLQILPANTAPSITSIPRQEIARGGAGTSISFTVGDLETEPNGLIVEIETSNPAAVPLSGLSVTGTGAERTLTMEPFDFEVGFSLVTVAVSDGSLESSTSFRVTVSAEHRVAVWDFNSNPPDNDAGSGTLDSSTGTGSSAAALGGVAESFGTVGGGSTSDPAPADDSMWRLVTFPAQGTGNKTAGIKVRASTAGHENISFQWDQYNSNTGSRYWRIQYTTNGVDFMDHAVHENRTPATWQLGHGVSFKSIPGANNNPNFGVRIVAEFESTATGAGIEGYSPVNEGSNYGAGGTLWVDMLTIGGDMMDGSNTQPKISAIPAQTTRENMATPPIPFTIEDAETGAENLALSFASSRPEIANSAAFGGSGTERTVTITPVLAATGSADITIRVTDGDNNFTETAFTLTVLAQNTAPVISSIPAQKTARDTVTAPVSFTIADLEQNPEQLTVRATSSKPELIGESDISIQGSGTNRTATITPRQGQVGACIISLTVSDGLLENSAEFEVKVVPANFIAQWNFNSGGDAEANTGTLTPSLGTGSATSIGSVTNSFGSVAGGATSDPAESDNLMVRFAGFPAQGIENRTAGLEFRASTKGRRDIAFVWDQYNSNTGSRYWRVQHSTNGMDFIDSVVFTNWIPTMWRNEQIADLSSVPGVNDNPNFAVRLVSEFESTATGSGVDEYIAANEGSSYGIAGTLWIDMVGIAGEPFDTPAPVSLSVSSSAGLVRISWPAAGGDEHKLQSASTLAAASWEPVVEVPSLEGSNYVVQLPASDEQRFFRLVN